MIKLNWKKFPDYIPGNNAECLIITDNGDVDFAIYINNIWRLQDTDFCPTFDILYYFNIDEFLLPEDIQASAIQFKEKRENEIKEFLNKAKTTK